MPVSDVMNAVAESGVVAVCRGVGCEEVSDLVAALREGGVYLVEFALSGPDGMKCIRVAQAQFYDHASVGAGSVLDPQSAWAAIDAGAKFIVTPSLNVDVVRLCHRYGVPVFSGALTPTEVISAWEAGADLVKVFPASTVGPRYLKDLHGPFPQVHLMPTGGINAENAAAFMKAGAVAVGAGSSLVDLRLVRSRDWLGITDRARQLVAAVRQGRGCAE